MKDKICLITGATSGIGKATAQALAEQGATVVLVARNPDKGAATVAEIKAATGNPNVDVLVADLSSQTSIRDLADAFRQKYDRLHVLINNAGAFYGDRHVTEDGLELTFALNHLAYFSLTNLLLDLLITSAPARIINLTSGAQGWGKIAFEDLQGEKRYSGQEAYNQSKLANVLFTYELARRLEGKNVTANCVHPGVVKTNFGRENPTFIMRWMIRVLSPIMRSPEKGAETVVYLASSPEVEGVTGQYFVDKKPVQSAKISYDVAVAQRLWQVSEALMAQFA